MALDDEEEEDEELTEDDEADEDWELEEPLEEDEEIGGDEDVAEIVVELATDVVVFVEELPVVLVVPESAKYDAPARAMMINIIMITIVAVRAIPFTPRILFGFLLIIGGYSDLR